MSINDREGLYEVLGHGIHTHYYIPVIFNSSQGICDGGRRGGTIIFIYIYIYCFGWLKHTTLFDT